MNARENGGQAPDPRHLLGGYASGTLTPDEQKLLFEAALTDPALFEELMREQALKETLRQPGARRELMEALDARPSTWDRLRQWIASPVGWSAAGAVAATVVVALFLGRHKEVAAPSVATVAQNEAQLALRLPEPAPETVAAPPPAKPAEKKAQPARNETRTAVLASRQMKQEAAREVPSLPAPPAVAVSADAALVREMGVQAPAAAPPPVPAEAAAELRKASAPAQPAIEYGILRGDGSGVFRPVATAAELGDSDRFKVTVTPKEDGVLTLLRRNRDQRVSVVARARATAGATLILPAEDSLRTSDIESVIIQLGDPAEADAKPVLGFSNQGFSAVPGGPPAASKARAKVAGTTAVEIPIRRRR